MNNIKSFYNYIREDSNQLIMKYIRNEVVDDYGWMKPGGRLGYIFR